MPKQVVINACPEFGNGYNFIGFSATVVDENDQFVCVRLRVSNIYTPLFWLNQNSVRSLTATFPPLSYSDIERALRGRRGDLPYSPITVGLLRSWLLLRMEVMEGHPLETIVGNLEFSPLMVMYSDRSDDWYREWVRVNDLRTQRARISTVEVQEPFKQSLSIRRPRMGG